MMGRVELGMCREGLAGIRSRPEEDSIGAAMGAGGGVQ